MEHGGDIYTEGILKGKTILDFSSNINPLGIPKSFIDNVGKAVQNMMAYPDIKYRQSKEAICNYLNTGLDYFYPEKEIPSFNFVQEDLVLGNGAGEIIDIAVGSLKSICIITPSFVEYEKSALKNNVEIIYASLDSQMNIDYKDLAEKIQQVDGVIVGNPNNPNGVTVDKKRFLPILDYCQQHNKRVILDEAFIEFTGDRGASLLELTKEYSCLCIIKALTKFYGMPGIRVGYSVCRDSVYNETMRARQIPWNINSFAEIALQHVLKDESYIKETLDWIREERMYMVESLKKLKIVEYIYQTEANFVLVKLKGITGSELHRLLMEKDILIRTCGNYRGLGSEYIRLAIKDRNSNEKLIQTIMTSIFQMY